MSHTVAELADAQALAVDKASVATWGIPMIYAGVNDVSGTGGTAQQGALERAAVKFEGNMAAYDASSILMGSDLTSGADYESRIEDDLANEWFDAIRARSLNLRLGKDTATPAGRD
jgi:hypothetical protein